jgi:hypothetical protein
MSQDYIDDVLTLNARDYPDRASASTRRCSAEKFALWHSCAYLLLGLRSLGSVLMERTLIGFIALVLLLMAVLPLFGFNLILVMGPASLEPFDPAIEPVYLFVARSAGLATAAFFAINFLRHRRPLTAAAPLLVYTNFTIFFGVAYLVQTPYFQLIQLWPAPFLLVLSIFLFRQNQRESAHIFSKDW